MESNAQFDSLLMVLRAFGPPLVLGLAGVLCAGALHRRGAARLAMAVLALALAAGFVGGHAAVNHEHWSLLPAQALDWLPVLAVLALAVLVALEWSGASPRTWLAAQAVLLAFGIWRMLPPALADGGAPRVAAWVAGLTLLWLALWRWLDGMGDERRQAALAMGVSSGALAFVVALGGSITIGLGAASLMAALGVLLLPALIGRAPALPRALLGCATLLYACLTLAALWYAEMPAWLLGLAAGGLLTVRLLRSAPLGAPRPQSRALALGVLAAAPLPLLAAGYALWSYLHQANAYY